jgi:hypothetical protein
MLKRILILFTVFAIVIIGACKKYPDGPILSVHTKTERIAGRAARFPGKGWDVTYFSVNGYDSTSYLKSQSVYRKYAFVRDHDGYYGEGTFGRDGHWQFDSNKEKLSLSINVNGPIGPYLANYVSWDIRRLTEKDLWLKTDYNGKEYFLKLKN